MTDNNKVSPEIKLYVKEQAEKARNQAIMVLAFVSAIVSIFIAIRAGQIIQNAIETRNIDKFEKEAKSKLDTIKEYEVNIKKVKIEVEKNFTQISGLVEEANTKAALVEEASKKSVSAVVDRQNTLEKKAVSLGKKIKETNKLSLQVLAQATCTSLHSDGGYAFAVGRTCSKNLTCDEICSSLSGPTGQLRCISAIHIYPEPPFNDNETLGLMTHRYGNCSFRKGCGPNYCCCVNLK